MHYTLNSTDTDLIQGCRYKNRLAQKYLYQKYYGKMLGICMRYASHKEEANDILNRAFLKVFNSIDQYQPTGAFSGWIAKIVFNTSIDFVRSQMHYKKIMDYNVEKEVEMSAKVIDQLYAEDLFRLIQRLPSTSRTVFSLFVIDGYKHREIAELLEINENTSKWHLSNAKKYLQKVITSEYNLPKRMNSKIG